MTEKFTTTEDCKVSQVVTEMESLKAVFHNEFVDVSSDDSNTEDKTSETKQFSINIFPSTADAKEEQFVRLTLHFKIPPNYPDEVPNIEFRNPRGLSEDKLENLKKSLVNLANEKKGNTVLYELIHFSKETLTANNFPAGNCMICLYEFTEEDVFVVTQCFHHFHCRCLIDYIESETEKKKQENEERSKMLASPQNSKETLTNSSNLINCPVCRKGSDLKSLLSKPSSEYPPPALSKKPINEEKSILEEAKRQQESYAPIYEKQQQQGGIIDEESEKKKILIISDKPVDKSLNASSSNDSSSSSTSKVKSESSDEKENSPLKDKTNDKISEETKNDEASAEKKDEKADKVENAVSKENVSSENDTNSKENKPTNKKSSRRVGRSRTKSGRQEGRGSSINKSDQVNQTDQKRNTSRRRERSNYDPNFVRPFRQGFRNNRGRGRGRGRNYYNNGGLPSPPYRHNLGSFYPNEDNRYRSNSYGQSDYQEDYVHERDRPGFYAARVFRHGNNKPISKPDETSNATSPGSAQVNSSEIQSTTEDGESRPRSASTSSKSKKTRKVNRNRRSRRYSSSDYQQPGNQNYTNVNHNTMDKRRNNYVGYYNYRSQNYNRGYNNYYGNVNGGYNYNSYNGGYSNNYGYRNNYQNYNYFRRYNNNYGYNNYGRPRYIWSNGARQNRNYQPRKRNDTVQSLTTKNVNQPQKVKSDTEAPVGQA